MQQFGKSNEMNYAEMLIRLDADFVALNLLKFKTAFEALLHPNQFSDL